MRYFINPMNQPLGQNLFCGFFNNGEVPLPPSGSSYFITEDSSDYFITEDGLNNFITE